MKKVICIVMMTILLAISTNVFAASPYAKIKIDPNTNVSQKGSKVVFTVSVDEFKGMQGLMAIGGVMEYDDAIFEYVEVKSLNNWNNITYNEQNKKFIVTKNEYGKEGDIFQITLKVKKNAKEGVSTVTIKEIDSSDGDLALTQEPISTTIGIAKVEAQFSILKLFVILAVSVVTIGVIVFLVIYFKKK